MKKLALLLVFIGLTSCSSYIDSLNAYRNSPAGQEELRRQFVLDSTRAANTQYPFRYDFNYYNTRWNRGLWVYPDYYYYYQPVRSGRLYRNVRPVRTRTRVVPNTRTRTNGTRTNVYRDRRGNNSSAGNTQVRTNRGRGYGNTNYNTGRNRNTPSVGTATGRRNRQHQ